MTLIPRNDRFLAVQSFARILIYYDVLFINTLTMLSHWLTGSPYSAIIANTVFINS